MTTLSSPEVLPRGRHAAPREVVVESQRTRLLTAMAHEVSLRGYASTTVADVLRAAGVSRRSFYEHFASKEDCFLQAFDLGVEVLIEALAGNVDRQASIAVNVHVAVSAYLATLQANPPVARTFLVEAMAAGPAALERRSEVIVRLAGLIRDVHLASEPAQSEKPPHRYQAAAAAINELVSDHVRHYGADALQELAPIVEDIVIVLVSTS